MSMSLADLERNLSLPRLNKYRSSAASDAEAMCLYVWNMALSAALQPAIHALEVTLRNSIHAAAIAWSGQHDWFRDPAWLNLQAKEQRMIDQAKEQLWIADGHDLRALRATSAPMPPLPSTDKHIAALTLGFWVALFGRPYRRMLWSNLAATATQPARKNLLIDVFPNATLAQRQQVDMHDRLRRIRDFRNRVSHHEPIWNWAKPAEGIADVQAQHQELLRVIGWISPASATLLGMADHFPTTYGHGHTHYLASVTLTP